MFSSDELLTELVKIDQIYMTYHPPVTLTPLPEVMLGRKLKHVATTRS